MAKKIKTAEEIRSEAIETARIVDDAMRNIASSLREAFGEAGKEVEDLGKEFVKEANKGLKGLTNNAEALFDAQDKGRKGLYTQKDLQKEIEKKAKSIFLIESKIAEAIANGAKNTGKLREELAKAVGEADKFTDSLKKSVDYSKNINKAMGLTGAGMKGMQKIAGKLGLSGLETVFEEAASASAKMAEELVDVADASNTTVGLGGKMKTAFAGAKVAAGGIGKALMDPLFIIGAIVKSVKFLVGIISHVRKLTADVGMQFGLGAEEARKLTHHIEDAAFAQDGYYHTAQELVDANKEINSTTGLQLKFNQKNAEQFRNIAVYQGMGVENAKALFKIATTTTTPFSQIDDSIRDTVNSLNASSDEFVNVGDVVTTMAGASADTRMSFNGNLDAMTKTAHVATRLGTSMEAIKNASRSTLNFQSSIEQEMEAEMMLGKNLNLEKLRSATLNRDLTVQVAEQRRLVAETMDDALTNELKLEAASKVLGLTTDQYVEIAENIKNNGKLQGENSKTEQKNQEANKKKAAEFERSMQKLKDSFSKMFLPIAEMLEPLMSGVATVISAVGKFLGTGPGKLIGKMVGLFAGGAIVFKAGKSLLSMFTGGSMFGKRGSSPMNPVFVSGDGGGGSNMTNLLKGNIFKYLGKKGGLSRTLNRTLIRSFGKNGFTKMMQTKVFNPLGKSSTMVGRGMNNLFGKIIPQSGANLTKAFGTNQMSKIQKMSQTGRNAAGQFISKAQQAKAGSMVSKFAKPGAGVVSKASGLLPKAVTSTLAKAGPALAKTLKVLGPIGIAADLVMGGASGYSQSQMSAEEQKAAGVEVGISATKASTLGVLTGGAEKGSMFSESLGIKKGSAGDEAMGIAGAAGRGALTGAAIGSFIPVVGTAVGAAVGGLIGGVSESFKVFSDPNSSLRKGISDFASSAGETISSWASSAGEGIKAFATSSFDSVKSLASGAADMATSAYDYVKDSSIGKGIASVGSGILEAASYLNPWSYFANGGIASGGFKAFANGGIASSPTMGLVGEGRYNEAIIPLPDGKSVPVQMSGGSGGGSEVAALLKELIMVVKEGGDIYMDGAKVGKSMVLSSSRLG